MNTMTVDVIAAQKGNLAAFERLVNATRNTVTSVALSIVRDVDISEDIAQQAYINCWNNLKTLKNSQSFLPWLRQSTRYIAINYLRDNKVGVKVVGTEAELIFAELSAEHGKPDLCLDQEQRKQAITYLLGQLPDESREIVTLYYREEQSTNAVAELLGLSEANVRKKLSRARSKMKDEVLAKYGRVLLSTAPAISFTSVVISSLAYSPQASASVVASQSTWWSKVSALFSGAFLGAFAAVVAILWSHKVAEKQLLDQDIKQQLNKLKYISVTWVIVSAFLFTVAFQLSTGAWAPITVYGMFAIGLYALTKKTQALMYLDMETNPDFDTQTTHYKRQKLWGAIGLYGGLICGVVAMLFGLYGSGRL